MYYQRLIEKVIDRKLKTSGAVLVQGPKFCGKSTTCKKFVKREYVIDDFNKIEYALNNPEAILKSDIYPKLIDEWQFVPNLWNKARTFIDKIGKNGLFILTGSSTPEDKNKILHSGAGRIVKINMETLTLSESRESKRIVSLSKLFKENKIDSVLNENYSIDDTAFLICRGGWPKSICSKKEYSIEETKNYVSTLFEFENSDHSIFRNKNKKIFVALLKAFSRNLSTETNFVTINNDVKKYYGSNIDYKTLISYKEGLEDLNILKFMDPWNPNLRSSTKIITSPTIHIVDTSLATSILNISPNDLLYDKETFGLFFEDFAIKELRTYTSILGGELRHFRDVNGLECDAVIHLPSGEYGLIEIKTGSKISIEKGCSKLLSLKAKLNNTENSAPKFLAIITAFGNSFTTEKGIHIIPINFLYE